MFTYFNKNFLLYNLIRFNFATKKNVPRRNMDRMPPR